MSEFNSTTDRDTYEVVLNLFYSFAGLSLIIDTLFMFWFVSFSVMFQFCFSMLLVASMLYVIGHAFVILFNLDDAPDSLDQVWSLEFATPSFKYWSGDNIRRFLFGNGMWSISGDHHDQRSVPSLPHNTRDTPAPRRRRRHNARVEPGGPVDINFARTLPGMQNFSFPPDNSEQSNQEQEHQDVNVDNVQQANEPASENDEKQKSDNKVSNETKVANSEVSMPSTSVDSVDKANKKEKQSRHFEANKKTKNQLKTEKVLANIERRREQDRLKQNKKSLNEKSKHPNGKIKESKAEKTDPKTVPTNKPKTKEIQSSKPKPKSPKENSHGKH